jgi:hypothetical protein
MMNQYDFSYFRIILIKEVECENFQDQIRQEQEMIDELKPKLNKKNAYSIKKEYQKKYYELNKCEIQEKTKQYREANKDKLKEKSKQYREANKDKAKQYREANKDKIKEIKKQYHEANKKMVYNYRRKFSQQHKDRYVCIDCDISTHSNRDFQRHLNTKSHWQNTLPVNID